MKEIMILCGLIIIPYLIGSINFSIILSKLIGGKDIRKSGSGNAGATNMLRTYGKKLAVVTLILDVLKGVVVIAAAYNVLFLAYSYPPYHSNALSFMLAMSGHYIAAVFVILGHDFPIYFGFKGGKGVATSLGAVLTLDWKLGLVILVCAVAVIAVTKYVSLGSVLGGIAFIVGESVKMAMSDNKLNIINLICVIIMGGLLVFRHKENIKRLLNGTENKLGAKGKAV